jgi:hypothetical protein
MSQQLFSMDDARAEMGVSMDFSKMSDRTQPLQSDEPAGNVADHKYLKMCASGSEQDLKSHFEDAEKVQIVTATLRFVEGSFRGSFLESLERKLASQPTFMASIILADPYSSIFAGLRPNEDRPSTDAADVLRRLNALKERYHQLTVRLVDKPLYHSTYSFWKASNNKVTVVVDHFEGLPSSCGTARIVTDEGDVFFAEFENILSLSYAPNLPDLDDPDLLAALDFVGLVPVSRVVAAKLGSCGLEQMIEKVVFSHEEPRVEESDSLLPEHIISLGFKPAVAKKIARRAMIYTSVSSHREAVVRAAIHFLPRASPLPKWIEGQSKDTPIEVRQTASLCVKSRARAQFTAICINYGDFVAGSCHALSRLLDPKPGRRYLFHGTSVSAATNIMNRGVRLQNGKPQQYFSVTDHRGYYVTTELHMAMKRAFLAQRSNERFCAVVVHDLPIDLPEHFSHLALPSQSPEWVDLVRSCRVDDRWPDSIEDLEHPPHYISGNICVNPQYLAAPHFRLSDSFDRGVTQSQLCVVDDGLAQEFTQAITLVVYVFSPAE